LHYYYIAFAVFVKAFLIANIAFVVFSCYDRTAPQKGGIVTETINDRIKQVRKSLKLNQADFGEQVALAQTYLSQIERGDREVTEKILKLVCLQFNVSERWLRTGEGSMFEESSDSLISQLCEKYKLDNMAHIILKTFVAMPQNERDTVMNFARRVAETANHSAEEEQDAPDAPAVPGRFAAAEIKKPPTRNA
jgi:DNA-binding helix-turn-helix protein